MQILCEGNQLKIQGLIIKFTCFLLMKNYFHREQISVIKNCLWSHPLLLWIKVTQSELIYRMSINKLHQLLLYLHTGNINASGLHLYWIMWKIIDRHCWTFCGSPISWNPQLLPIIILCPELSLKGFVNSKLAYFRLCPTNKLLDIVSGGML